MRDKPLKQLPFKFLSKEEYARLTHEEQIEYVRSAVEAIKRGDPLDDLPVGDIRSPGFEAPLK